MNQEIINLNLPRGIWQTLIKEAISSYVSKVECFYPDARTIHFKMFNELEKPVGHFSLSFLYGCKGILVSHEMFIEHEYRGKGIAKKLQPIKNKIAKDLKVSLLLATVKSDNFKEKSVIKKENWKHLSTFKNALRTNNMVEIHIKELESSMSQSSSCNSGIW